ncbi:MAG: SUMF1/EgtB/PvdO family nonheme iron enzyme [Rhodomicrobium sp.]
MEDEQNFYTIIGVSPDAPEAEIRRAFRTRAKALHPDIQPAGGQEEASREFSLVTEAYETLKDPARRQVYDEELIRSRQVALHSEKQGKPRRAFAAGLGIGLLFVVVAFGAKILVDRAGMQAGAPKSQESLRIGKAENPSFAAPREPALEADGRMGLPAAAGRADEEDARNALRPEAPGDSQQTAPLAESSPQLSGAQPSGSPSAIQSEPIPEGAAARQVMPHSQFSEAVLLAERSMNTSKGGSAAYGLVSLIDSANSIESLMEAGSLARRPETRGLIRERIAALKAGQKEEPATASEQGGHSLQENAAGGAPHLKEDDIAVRFAAGPHTSETVLRLIPGKGLAESFSDCSSCPEMVVIPGGQAVIGSRPENASYRSEEAPAHRITIRKPLAVSKYGVSAENWRACVEAGVCRPTISSYLSVGPGVPATRISWFEAKSYADWLSHSTGRRYRLLSEAEWEYAAQAGAKSLEGTASKPGVAAPGPIAGPGLLRYGITTAKLAAKPNGWGLQPLPGNILEWVEDCWHPNYAQAPADGSPWLSGSGGDCAYRSVRGIAAPGGRFGGRRIAARAREFADTRSPTLGFRVARELPVRPKAVLDATAAAGRKALRGD